MPRSVARLGLVALFATACMPGSLTIPPVETLESTPEAVTYGQASLVLRSELVRMQTAEGPSITSTVTVLNTKGDPLPDGLKVDGIFLIFDGAAWSQYLPELPPADGDRIEAVVSGGPRWPPGEQVDVVVRVAPAAGRSFLLRQANVTIGGN
jgi:hypothetical protein